MHSCKVGRRKSVNREFHKNMVCCQESEVEREEEKGDNIVKYFYHVDSNFLFDSIIHKICLAIGITSEK